mmetsp:Transcript_11275/g.13666  ORF Transcript_11275/g.13666 Transcript_11275/m.13666 type:complete len:391 (+) Transcript_11275:159-1331(+)
MALSLDILREALCHAQAEPKRAIEVPVAITSYLLDLQEAKKQELATCSFCAKIGCKDSPQQVLARESLLNYGGPNALERILGKFEKALDKALSEENPFLAGDEIGEKDLEALLAIFPFYTSVLLPETRADYPRTGKWFSSCLGKDLNRKLGANHHLAGEERVGGQIDCFPDSRIVREKADATKALNAEYKKKANQRQKEKAQKEKAPAANNSVPAEAKTITIAPLGLEQEEAQARLWKRLAEMDVIPYKEDNVNLETKRPDGHSTHNLLVKDKKSKQLFLVATRQSINVNLKSLSKQLKVKELRLARSSKECLCIDKSCLSLLSLWNNSGAVVPVIDSKLFDGENILRICSGCKDPLDHSQHNMVDVTPSMIKQILTESNTPTPIYVDLE